MMKVSIIAHIADRNQARRCIQLVLAFLLFDESRNHRKNLRLRCGYRRCPQKFLSFVLATKESAMA